MGFLKRRDSIAGLGMGVHGVLDAGSARIYSLMQVHYHLMSIYTN